MRVLHGPANVGNQPWSLSRAERALQLRSDLVVNYDTWIGYPADRVLTPFGDKSFRAAITRAGFALSAPLRYDILHYYFGRSFLLWDDWGFAFGRSRWIDAVALLEVRLAKLLGRRRFMTLQGCDVRIAENSNTANTWTPCSEGRCSVFDSCLSRYDKDRRAMIRKLLPLMDRVFYLNPELGRWVAGGTFLPYANVSIRDTEILPPRTSGRLRIVHAPSDPNIKGTSMLRSALDTLSRSFDFELILVEGKTHLEAMEIYRSADLAIDQLLAGWYGGFAVELMAMGKPVAAYIREDDRRFVPSEMWDEMPILRLRPEALVQDLANVLSHPEKLETLSVRSRSYVERWHDPAKLASALAKIYRNPKSPLNL